MLTKLDVQNYALIRSLSIDWSKGLNIITGETGAGKSILMGALGLLLGNRADTKVLYKEDKKCIVEGVFSISGYELESYIQQNDLEYDDPLIIRREIYPRGKSRAFINDSLVNLSILRGISDRLVDVYAQFESLEINQTENQFKVLDAIGGALDLSNTYQVHYAEWLRQRQLLKQKLAAQATLAKELDYLKFQWEELDVLNLDLDKDSKLEQEHEIMTHAVEIKENSQKAIDLIHGRVLDSLYQVNQLLAPLNNKHPQIEKLLQILFQVIEEGKELASGVEEMVENLDFDPEKAALIEERMSTLFRLFRKHQVEGAEGLIDVREKLMTQIENGQKSETDISDLNKNIRKLEQQLHSIAAKLHDHRKNSVELMETEMEVLLKRLGMNDAKFRLQLEKNTELNRYGLNSLQFLFSANLGTKLLPVSHAASGGELSRLNLCIKTMIASKITLPTLIFDEIDSGISGHIAGKMGTMLKQLADKHQVICITHSPQISSKADNHYFVAKKTNNGQTETIIRPLTNEERIREIAIMLSKNPPTESALANAKELLS